MNGAQHYAEAERLMAMGEGAARAQVHATLALAAATFDVSTTVRNEDVALDWAKALQ